MIAQFCVQPLEQRRGRLDAYCAQSLVERRQCAERRAQMRQISWSRRTQSDARQNPRQRTSSSITLSRASNAPFSESSTFNGTRYVLITAGSLTNYWVPAARLTLG